MQKYRRELILSIFGMGLIKILNGCVAVESNMKVYHGLAIELHDDAVRAVNILFTYGNEFVNETRSSANSIVPLIVYFAMMPIPEEFQISWETQDGKMHGATVPVRSRLPGTVQNKTILFVITQDHIEGYVAISTPSGKVRKRFY